MSCLSRAPARHGCFARQALLLCALTFWVADAAWAADPITFEEQIRPIFRAHCFDCHGATEELKGGLDLRLVRRIKTGGDSGPAIVAGEPDASYLLERVRSGEMPPGEKRVEPEQIAILARWIAQGATTKRPESELPGAGLTVTPEDRSFWSFQPIRQPVVPQFGPEHRVRGPIDALLLDAMPAGLSFSPDADRLTLIKRLYLQLTGLPPEWDSIQRWVSDPSQDWYQRLVDQLLDSPHYGERWARHWLDVAGYADSEGYTNADALRPWAWKYRDYVIRALNEDKPFDRFLTEQLAGDELAGPKQGDWTRRQIELLTATGFLRMAADGTGSGADGAEARNQVMADTLRIVGSSLLGLSLACAQCHDHRYDPILQTDYYALRAVFEPALDWQRWQTPQQRLVSLYTQSDRQQAARVGSEARLVVAEKNEKQRGFMARALEQELQKYEPSLRRQLKAAYETAVDQRTPQQQLLLKRYPSVNITPGVLYQYLPEAAEELKEYDARIAKIRAKKPPEQFVRALVEREDHLPETRLFHRGDHRQPKQPVAPAAPAVLSDPSADRRFPLDDDAVSTSGRRLALARWLTDRGNPLVARVIVNRVWMHHFGRGLVDTPSDFGRLGSDPTHPELLDWLAAEFTQHGWSLKWLHRQIVHSTAWRQKAIREPTRDAIDPENRYYWRRSVLRLEAEALRDRMLAVTGRLDRTRFGAPVNIKEDDTGQVVVDGTRPRRSIYVRVRRSRPVAMLQAFDAPVMETNCERRPVSTVATQSLMLMNGGFTLSQAKQLAERAQRESEAAGSAGPNDLSQAVVPADSPQPQLRPVVVRAWQLALCRQPTSDELALAVEFVQRQTATIEQNGLALPDETSPRGQALANVCQALLSSNEFMYVD